MSQTLHDIKETLKGMFNVSACVKQHPFLITGSAVAVGFVTGAALTPSRGENIKKIRSNSVVELQPSHLGQEPGNARKSFLFSTLGTVLVGILKTVVQGLLATAFVTKEGAEAQSPPDSAGVAAPENGTV
jgi:hypothetical protein